MWKGQRTPLSLKYGDIVFIFRINRWRKKQNTLSKNHQGLKKKKKISQQNNYILMN